MRDERGRGRPLPAAEERGLLEEGDVGRGHEEFVAAERGAPRRGRRRAGRKGPRGRAAALLGAVLMVLSDLACRTAPAEWNLRLGVVTAIAGAPYFLYLLARQRRGQAL